MAPTYLPILKSLTSEYEASKHMDVAHAAAIHPLFDVPVISENRQKAKKYQNSPTPKCDYLDEVAESVAKYWKGPLVLADAFNWAPDATVETGEHALAYLHASLKGQGVTVAPVVGYDRWDDQIYQLAMRGLDLSDAPYVCLRLEASAIEDAAEPDVFHDRIHEILEDMQLVPAGCAVLLDLGDLTSKSLMDITGDATRVLELLIEYGFRYIATAGSSMPKSVDLAVKKKDSTAKVIRKEMLLWQALRTEFSGISLVFGDYGVRGPGSNDAIRNPNANAKIRYTCDKAFLVSRGHSVVGGWALQMSAVATEIVNSKEFLPGFSWGDQVIADCSNGLPVKNGHGKWIAYDTSHHLAFVVAEVQEFERVLTLATRATTA
ncbi:beta family protein [Stenotrophomonas sp.]|uniref:beta family protein n=1 Tax=Stenotrophomonas sp. TaxID=69392 RepID=UPI0028973DAB|nr:beta family protein [Stenotrophomonas sp.]